MTLLQNIHGKLHFVGIGGVGMTALAWYLREVGWEISGSDSHDFRMRKKLEEKGIKVYLSHDELLVQDAVALIHTSAVPVSHIEVRMALSMGIPVLERMEAVKVILKDKQLLAVTGSYGKSTATTFLSSMMKQAQCNPDWLIGADMMCYPPAQYVKSSLLVLECDESKPQFLSLDPDALLITNVGKDHLQEYGHSMNNLAKAFEDLALRVPKSGIIVLNGDDPLLLGLSKKIHGKKIVTCGQQKHNDYCFTDIDIHWDGKAFSSAFKLSNAQGFCLGKKRIPMPGWQNIQDAVMAQLITAHYSSSIEEGQDLYDQLPVMDRRMQVKGTYRDCIVFDDEGDSPEVIRWALQALKKYFPKKKLLCILQPHRFSRLSNLFHEYASVLVEEADDVVLLPVYSAGETELAGFNSETLARQMITMGFNGRVLLVETHEEAAQKVSQYLNQQASIICLGPGDVWKVGDALSAIISSLS